MDQLERIDLYLDKQLPAEQSIQFEEELQHSTELRELMNRVLIARQAVRSGALRTDMRRWHRQFVAELPDEEAEVDDDTSGTGRVIPMAASPRRTTAWGMRIAASLLLTLLAYGAYLYSELSPAGLYKAKYVQYQLPTARGPEAAFNRLDSLYLQKDYQGVIRQSGLQEGRSQRDFFLTGLAHLQMNQHDDAIRQFTALRDRNARQFKSYYEQETDYYLALAYLGAGRVDEAHALFEVIHRSPRHLFHRNVKNSDLLMLKLLKYKL